MSVVRNYFTRSFVFDLKAGFITAIVALPLAIAFSIASGVEPLMGLYTAVVAGALVSVVGGSRFSITGPTGAMAVIILSTIAAQGIEGLLLAGFLAGVIQLLLGLFRLGRLVKFIPYPIISGFTAGIGALILIGQLPNALGLQLPPQEHVWTIFALIANHWGLASVVAVAITVGTVALLWFLPSWFSKNAFLKNIPASIVALVISTALAFVFGLQIPLVGAIPVVVPAIHWPAFGFDLALAVLPSAFTIALLGSIEALLCAVVCDGMTNTKHESNRELRAQGVANMLLPFIGAIPSTAAIARSAVNIREGAKTRLAGVYHALILGCIVLFFGGVARFIPKAFLAGVLIFVSVRMINIQEFRTVMRISKQEFFVLLVTFVLTVLVDLVFAVQVGLVLAIGLVFVRLSRLLAVTSLDEHDPKNELPGIINGDQELKAAIGIYTLAGPFFFGAMNMFDQALGEQLNMKKRFLLLRMQHVPFIDSSAAERLKQFIRERNRVGGKVFLVSLHPRVRKTLFADDEFRELIVNNNLFESTQEAVDYVRNHYISPQCAFDSSVRS